ncbi:hypothetical protein V5799_013584 [Amblyomma americanum]|uniref:U1-type domain-containing protein n=1 Tax=Amblyomma americanum TaxID=6943 RepID=A0AAQ4E5J1_AMBAM
MVAIAIFPQATPSHERPWAEAEKQQQAGTQKFHRTIVSAVKGVQFLVGISGYYCKLCKVMSGDSAMARNHLHSIEHNQNYTKYILLNPFYERRWKMEKDIAIGAAIKEEKEKKKQEKEKQEKEKFEKERDKSRSRSRSPTAPSSFEHNFSSKRSKSSRKEEQEKIRRKSEELLKAERENSRSVKELDDSDVSPKKGGDKSASPPPSRANTGGSGIKLKLLKGQKTQKQPPKQTPVVIIGKAPCFRPSFLSGKPKVGAAATATTAKQEESKPYGPALPPNLASATAAELVEEAKKNEESMEIPLPNSASEKPGLLPTPVTSVAPTVPTPAPPTSAMLVSRKQALKSGVVTKTPLLPLPGSSMSEEDMDLKLLGIERDDIQPIAPVKPPPAFGPAPPPTSPVQLPNLSVPPPMFPVPPPKRTLLPSPRYLATVPPPTMAPLNVPPPTVVPLQVLRLPPPPPPAEPVPSALPPPSPATMARRVPVQKITGVAIKSVAAPISATPVKPVQGSVVSLGSGDGKHVTSATAEGPAKSGGGDAESVAATSDVEATRVVTSAEVKPEAEDTEATISGTASGSVDQTSVAPSVAPEATESSEPAVPKEPAADSDAPASVTYNSDDKLKCATSAGDEAKVTLTSHLASDVPTNHDGSKASIKAEASCTVAETATASSTVGNTSTTDSNAPASVTYNSDDKLKCATSSGDEAEVTLTSHLASDVPTNHDGSKASIKAEASCTVAETATASSTVGNTSEPVQEMQELGSGEASNALSAQVGGEPEVSVTSFVSPIPETLPPLGAHIEGGRNSELAEDSGRNFLEATEAADEKQGSRVPSMDQADIAVAKAEQESAGAHLQALCVRELAEGEILSAESESVGPQREGSSMGEDAAGDTALSVKIIEEELSQADSGAEDSSRISSGVLDEVSGILSNQVDESSTTAVEDAGGNNVSASMEASYDNSGEATVENDKALSEESVPLATEAELLSVEDGGPKKHPSAAMNEEVGFEGEEPAVEDASFTQTPGESTERSVPEDKEVACTAEYTPTHSGDDGVAQFVSCEEQAGADLNKAEVLNSVARAAGQPEAMIDADESCMEFGTADETFGCRSDAEAPFMSFDEPSTDCSVPAVPTLGLDSLLDDCPDWKAAILCVADLDNTKPGKSLFNSTSVAAELLATSAVAATQENAEVEDGGLGKGGQRPETGLLQSELVSSHRLACTSVPAAAYAFFC